MIDCLYSPSGNSIYRVLKSSDSRGAILSYFEASKGTRTHAASTLKTELVFRPVLIIVMDILGPGCCPARGDRGRLCWECWVRIPLIMPRAYSSEGRETEPQNQQQQIM